VKSRTQQLISEEKEIRNDRLTVVEEEGGEKGGYSGRGRGKALCRFLTVGEVEWVLRNLPLVEMKQGVTLLPFSREENISALRRKAAVKNIGGR